MEEYRKPYEYEDESGVAGLLLMFFIMVIFFEMTLGFISLVMGQEYYKSIQILKVPMLFISIAYILYILFTCVALFKIPKLVMPLVKFFLIFRIIYLAPIFIINFTRALNNTQYTRHRTGIAPVIEISAYMLLLPFTYLLVFSLLWFLYFKRSERVKSLYGKTPGSI